MTITYLNMANMQTDKSTNEVVKILRNAGYQTIAVDGREIKIGWRRLTKEELQKIRQELEMNGHALNSICQASWLSRPVGLDML